MVMQAIGILLILGAIYLIVNALHELSKSKNEELSFFSFLLAVFMIFMALIFASNPSGCSSSQWSPAPTTQPK